MTDLKFNKWIFLATMVLQASCSLVDQFKEKYDETKEDEKDVIMQATFVD